MAQANASHSRQPSGLKGLEHLIGHTPLLAITYHLRGQERQVFAKAEQMNFSGSIKDRMALHILAKAYQGGRIHPGDRIIEATSGNTGIAFAALGRALGHPVTIYMPAWMSRERVAVMRSLGADLRLVSREEGSFLDCIRLTQTCAAQEEGAFLPCQFSNADNVEAHERSTGVEIWQQLGCLDLKPDAFVAGVGTGGTVMGVGRCLRRLHPGVRIHPLQPAESPTLSTGHQVGHHRIEGISDEFIPPIMQLNELDAVLSVHDGDAILMAQKLAAALGLGVGISSGANLLGAIMAQELLGSRAVVVTILPDNNLRYLSTDLLQAEPVREDYLTPQITLLGFEAFPSS
jgi:cysteine synthase